MIRVECRNCGTRLKGPDDAVGKSIKCPKCGNRIPVPRPDPEPDEDLSPPDDAYGFDQPALPRLAARPPLASGDDDIAALKKPKKSKAKRKKQSSAEDDDLSGLDTVLCLLCPGIACIASIVYMIQGKGKGLKVFGLAILGNILWGVVRYMIASSMNQPGGGP